MRRIALAFALPALLAATMAEAQSSAACITAAEGEGLALYVMPEVIRTVSETCRAHLPAGAYISNAAPLVAKFRAESEAAWPAARAAFGKIAGDDVRPFLDGDMAKPMLSAMIAPMLASEIKPKDCTAINRMTELLQPLPARNMAALFIAIAQLGMEKDKDGASGKLNLCPFEGER